MRPRQATALAILVLLLAAAAASAAQAPDFTLKTFDGKTIALRDLRRKVVGLLFWAAW